MAMAGRRPAGAGASSRHISMVYVHPQDWAAAGEQDRSAYASRAVEAGWLLSAATPMVQRGWVTAVLDPLREGSTTIEVSTFGDFMNCGRHQWEHELRRLLEIEDPCFGTTPHPPSPGSASQSATAATPAPRHRRRRFSLK